MEQQTLVALTVVIGMPFCTSVFAVMLLPDLRSIKYAIIGPAILVPVAIVSIQNLEPGIFSETAGLAYFWVFMMAVVATLPMMLGLVCGYWLQMILTRYRERGR